MGKLVLLLFLTSCAIYDSSNEEDIMLIRLLGEEMDYIDCRNKSYGEEICKKLLK